MIESLKEWDYIHSVFIITAKFGYWRLAASRGMAVILIFLCFRGAFLTLQRSFAS